MRDNCTYEMFIEKVKKSFSEYFGEEYSVDVKPVEKLNSVLLYGLNIMKKGDHICPTIYLESFFERYEEGELFSSIFKDILEIYDRHKKTDFLPEDFFTDYEKIKNKLNIKLISQKYNEELLKDVPYKAVLDLAIVCMVEVDSADDVMGTVLIHNNHICMWGISEEILIDDAVANAMRISEPKVDRITDVLKNMMAGTEEFEEFEDDWSNLEERCGMFVLSNKRQICGAAVMVFPGLLERVAKCLEGDFYIIPSSIHELILVPVMEGIGSEELNEMINSVNTEVLSREEILSDHAYYFKKEGGILSTVENCGKCEKIGM